MQSTIEHVGVLRQMRILRMTLGIACVLMILIACTPDSEVDQHKPSEEGRVATDSILAYDPDTYEEIVIIYTMPADMILKGRRGAIRDHMLYQADKLSIDTTIVYNPDEFKLKRWEITAVPRVE